MTIFKIPSNADVNFVSDLKEQMVIACQSEQPIDLDMSEVEVVTTPLLQLILVLQKKAEECSIALSLINPSESFREALVTFGCLQYLERVMK